jgi:hypothetical protein
MIQLKVYDTPAKETQHWLDLYDTEPIKLTLSIEDITSTDATSTFSKAFKVPGTRANAEFFKNSFDVDGVLFDVTIKKPAEILVDGTEFKQGHIRLQKVFLNTEQDRYDYELLFLGETRDFSSIIGDKGLCQLVMPDLVGGIRVDPDVATVMTPLAVSQSWTAYPQAYNPSTGIPYTPSITQGLHNGNIIYPLIDHGNTYDDAGQSIETKIGIEPTPAQGNHNWFTNSNHPITLDRFKPMIRAKRIIDQIFEDAGYTYTSEFFESDLFHQIYISAFGNEPKVGWDSATASEDSINVAYGEDLTSQQGLGPLTFENNQIDGGNNLSLGLYNNSPWVNNPATFYEISAVGEYRFRASAWWQGYCEQSNGDNYAVFGVLQIWNETTNQMLHFGSPAGGQGGTSQTGIYTVNTSSGDINVGDKIALIMSYDGGCLDYDYTTNVKFEVLTAPGEFNPVNMLDCQYKQIDFIKDILTAFRLVLAPNPRDPKDFIVEPWQTYINSGDLHDWSKKLVENKDVQIEPVFFSQSDTIHFSFQPGGDYTNIYNQQAKTHPWGYLPFTSGNDLLKGNRDVKLIGISPTPLAAIENGDYTWSLAQLHTHSTEDAGLQHLPIRPKTRMLFYNGMVPVTVTTPLTFWYFLNSTGNVTEEKWDIYPLVSSYQEWPIVSDTLNLNWQNDTKYFMGPNTDPLYQQDGTTLYDNYWSRYIQSLYGKYSRRVNATFILNNIDLNEFSFDDTIFVNGTYYIPEKVIDVEVGAYTEVKVQLLTANDFRPTLNLLQDLIINSATGIGSPCGGGLGSIDVNAEGTAPFTWSLSNGMSGAAVTGASPGPPPYDFTISNIPVGTYTLTLVDSLGRNADISVTIPQSIAAPVTSTFIATPASDCVTCDGAVNVTPAGGISPYTIVWNDGNTSFSRTGLCPGVDYSYTVSDSLGCSYESTLVQITCEGPQVNVYKFGRIGADCNTMIAEFKYVELISPPNISDVYTLESIGGEQVYKGCWSYIGVVGGVADAQLGQAWINCPACQNQGAYLYGIAYYDPEGGCITGGNFNWTVRSLQPIPIGTTITLNNIDPNASSELFEGVCYEISFEGASIPVADVAVVYDSCEICQQGPPPPPTYNYRITDCESGQSYNMEKGGCTFIVGDVLQYIRNSDPTRIYCGTVIDVSFPSGFEDSTIFGCIGRDCDDFVHCDIAAPPTVCVTNFGASMAPCIGGTLDEYMEGWVDLSAPTPTAATFRLVVGWVEGLNGNCSNVQYIQDLYVDIEAGESSGLLTCNNGAPFISVSGATICSVQLVETPYPEC